MLLHDPREKAARYLSELLQLQLQPNSTNTFSQEGLSFGGMGTDGREKGVRNSMFPFSDFLTKDFVSQFA